VKKLIFTIVIVMLSGCATVQQSSYDMRDRMNSVRIGMTHQEVEHLIGKPTFVTNAGTTEICDYSFDTLNSVNSLRSFYKGDDNIGANISMVVVYSDGRVLSLQGSYDTDHPVTNVFPNNSSSYNTKDMSPKVERSDDMQSSTTVHNNTTQSAGVHVNNDMVVTSVALNSPAYNASLKINDKILAFDGISVTDTASLKKLTNAVTFGDRKIIRIQREDKIIDLTICYPQRGDDK